MECAEERARRMFGSGCVQPKPTSLEAIRVDSTACRSRSLQLEPLDWRVPARERATPGRADRDRGLFRALGEKAGATMIDAAELRSYGIDRDMPRVRAAPSELGAAERRLKLANMAQIRDRDEIS